jgi:hypothetical protein
VEHLSSIEASIQAMCTMMRCLAPGGLAIHTTELQIGCYDTRLALGGTVLFQPDDLLRLQDRLAAQGDRLWPLDLAAGSLAADRHLGEPPFTGDTPHLTLRVFGEVGGRRTGFVTTSIALIASRGGT